MSQKTKSWSQKKNNRIPLPTKKQKKDSDNKKEEIDVKKNKDIIKKVNKTKNSLTKLTK